jgi:hypothetical protein
MSDSYSEVTQQSWFSRIGNSIKSVLFGAILFIVSIPLLFWNEGRAVHTAQSLAEGKGVVVDTLPDRVSPALDKHLVHITGTAVTDDVLKDDDFGVTVQAIKLARKAEIYQWEEKETSETRNKTGGDSETIRKWDYNKVWSPEPINSSSFKKSGHDNTGALSTPSRQQMAKDVKVGAFKLPPMLIDQFYDFEPLPVTNEAESTLPSGQQGRFQIRNQGFYHGKNPDQPEIGDIRVSFEVVRPGTVSIVAQQTGDTFEAYKAHAGGTIAWLKSGSLSAADMFAAKETENTIITWLLRGVGFLLMAFGLGMCFSPLAVLADVLPFLGDLMRMGTGLFAAVIAASISLLTIASAWFFYRPILAGVLIVVAFALFFGIKKLGKSKAAHAAPPPPPPPLSETLPHTPRG